VPDETIAGFQAEEPVSGQFPTVTITREILLNSVTPKEYSDSGLQQVAALPGYEEIDSKSVTIDEEKISMHVFVAKPVATEPARRFTQVSTVYDGNGYAVTAMTPISVEDDLDQAIELILKNVIFKEPVEEDD